MSESLIMTRLCKSEPRNTETSSSQTMGNMQICTYSGSTTPRCPPVRDRHLADPSVSRDNAGRPAEDGTNSAVPTVPPRVITPTFAPNVEAMPTLEVNVSRRKGSEWSPLSTFWSARPRYARDFIWEADEPERVSSAGMSLQLSPVPAPPQNEQDNPIARTTIRTSRHLFRVVTPINIARYASMLRTHPNQPLVVSVLRGLREGFWPWANTVESGRPPIVDNSDREIRDPTHRVFIQNQRDEELALGRFSPGFDSLQPGMTCVPLWVVPKPHSNKLRLIVDHSAGLHSPNSYIPVHEGHVHLNTLHQLGSALIQARRQYGEKVKLVLFKSDVSQAYRRLPMHYLWQLHQVVRIDGRYHVDRNNNFGNRGAGRVWFTFFSLVLWIAVVIVRISDLYAYVDDSYSWDFADNFAYYPRYQKSLPAKQVKFLRLLDDLSVPHEEHKQVHGVSLDIIGLSVDTDAMTITMPAEARSDLVATIRNFANPGQRRSLRDYQRLAGWINWAFNAYPMLRPGLSALYEKMRHGVRPHTLLTVNVSIVRELLWIADHIDRSSGVHMLTSQVWTEDDADITYLSDACPAGMGFWSPKTCEGFQCRVPLSSPQPIFYLEALALLSAYHHACMSVQP